MAKSSQVACSEATASEESRLLALHLALVYCVPAYGMNRERKLSELHHTSWTYADGAPGEVYALAQTNDGYLWLGTATGLFRFDGVRFQPYTPHSGRAFPQRYVSSLLAVPDGGLWVGYRFGGVSFIVDGTATDYGTPEGLPSSAVRALARDRRGTIWLAAGQDGLVRLEGSRWSRVGSDWGFEGPAHSLFRGSRRHALGGDADQCRIAHGRRPPVPDRCTRPPADRARVCRSARWHSMDGRRGLRRPARSVARKKHRGPEPAVLVGSLAIKFDDQGSLWVTSFGDGIRRVAHPERLSPPTIQGPSARKFHNPEEVEAFTDENGLTSDLTYSVLQDREGNVWIGTSAGLDRFRQSPVVPVPLRPLSIRGERPIPSQRSFATSALAAGDQGALWVSGMGPQVLLKIQNDTIATQLRDRAVDAAYRDRNGVVWLSTPSSILRIAQDRVETIDLPTADGITVSPQSRVRAITRDRLGRLWLSMPSGTFRLDGSALVQPREPGWSERHGNCGIY